MSTVSLVKCRDYASPGLEEALERALAPLGGMAAFVRPGQRVLIKPNMLSAHAPERQITTHPALVLAVGRLAIAAGGSVTIADSPAIEPFGRVAAKTGLAQAAAEMGAEIRELTEPTPAPAGQGAVFRGLQLARLALAADVIINLPKLKTHSQMLLTLGVKNLFGTVVAQRKSEWHLVAGVDRPHFANLLLDIHQALRPGLTILDGVWGMEGRGPSNGQPRQTGLLAASADALALDLTVCRLLGVPLASFPLYLAARARGLVTPEVEHPELAGDPPEDLAVQGFVLPELQAVGFLPRRLDWFTQRHLVSRPVAAPGRCGRCGKCKAICPADALSLEPGGPVFDYARCIRCYCCQEVCPEDAIAFRRGLLLRLLGALGR